MSSKDLIIDRLAVAALVVLMAALAAAVAMLPALPVDETRYLTVAWEMRVTGNWSLPTLNFEPYSHKPPLLFWLINGSWSLLGLGVWQARLVGALATAAVLVLTHHLDRRLVRDGRRGPAASVLLLIGLPLFVTLGFSIMFDMLLTASVAGAMLALWTAGRTGARTAWIGYGACIGLGLLAKGPIVLVFTLPAALLGRIWIEPSQRRAWFARLGLSLGLGLAMALAWALRAAHLGGPDYAEMLLWKQSAGRIASSFAHARPFWFYVPAVLLFFTPLLLWRPFWVGLRASTTSDRNARNFLLCCILPAVAGLSAISGKQLHYLLPVLPAISLLISLGLGDTRPRPSDRLAMIVFAGVVFSGLAAASLARAYWPASDGDLVRIASTLSIPLLALTAAVIAGIIAVFGGTLQRALTALAMANLVFLGSLTVQARGTITHLFDLQPVADAVAGLGSRPIAVAQRTQGEVGFLARLRKPVILVPYESLSCWLAQHPDSRAIVRAKVADGGKTARTIPAAEVLYEKRYRMVEMISVVAAAPAQQGPIPSCEGHPPRDERP